MPRVTSAPECAHRSITGRSSASQQLLAEKSRYARVYVSEQAYQRAIGVCVDHYTASYRLSRSVTGQPRP